MYIDVIFLSILFIFLAKSTIIMHKKSFSRFN